jgi:arylsulfatase A-like enzyme
MSSSSSPTTPAGATTAFPATRRSPRRTSIRSPEGRRLARPFYVCPVCSPTRAEFLTGRYHPRGGVRGVSTGQERLDLDEKTIADAFKAAGYATGAFGKWHNGSQWPYHPMARGFDEYFGHTAGHWGEYFDAPLEENGKMVRTQGYIVDVCTDRRWRSSTKNKDKPFFCYVPFTTPHSPWACPKGLAALQGQADHPAGHAAGAGRSRPNPLRPGDGGEPGLERRPRAGKARGLELEDNTIVLYFSDNGPNSWRWNGGMKGRKGQHRRRRRALGLLPPLAREAAAGHTVTQISGAIDLLPTLTSLAGVPRVGDKPLDGRDLSPLLLKQPRPTGPIG